MRVCKSPFCGFALTFIHSHDTSEPEPRDVFGGGQAYSYEATTTTALTAAHGKEDSYSVCGSVGANVEFFVASFGVKIAITSLPTATADLLSAGWRARRPSR